MGKKLGAVLENGGDPVEEGDTIATVADGIRVKNVGSHCMPQLMKYCTGNVITVVSFEEENGWNGKFRQRRRSEKR